VAAVVFVLVGEVGLGSRHEGGKLLVVLGADVLEGQDGSSLLMDDGAEASLGLDNHVGNTHLAAEGWEENDKLNGVDIVGNDDKVGFLGLDEGNAVVEPVLDEQRLLGVLVLGLLGLGSNLGGLTQAGFLLLLGLGAVLVQELEQLNSGILVEGVLELGDRRRDFETLVEDDLLALETDVFGPFDEPGEVGLGANVLADTKVARGGRKQRVLS